MSRKAKSARQNGGRTTAMRKRVNDRSSLKFEVLNKQMYVEVTEHLFTKEGVVKVKNLREYDSLLHCKQPLLNGAYLTHTNVMLKVIAKDEDNLNTYKTKMYVKQ